MCYGAGTTAAGRVPPFIVLNTEFIILNTEFIIVDTKFIISEMQNSSLENSSFLNANFIFFLSAAVAAAPPCQLEQVSLMEEC